VRFRDPAQQFDLKQAAAKLRAEPHPSVEGHRQIALFRYGPVTSVLYLFEPDGHINQHPTEGVVTIQALVGQLLVTAAGTTHNIAAGQMVALAPGVPLTVRAVTASEMLFTVHHEE
jgi:quercetin dioxygenase-like cupin family protein